MGGLTFQTGPATKGCKCVLVRVPALSRVDKAAVSAPDGPHGGIRRDLRQIRTISAHEKSRRSNINRFGPKAVAAARDALIHANILRRSGALINTVDRVVLELTRGQRRAPVGRPWGRRAVPRRGGRPLCGPQAEASHSSPSSGIPGAGTAWRASTTRPTRSGPIGSRAAPTGACAVSAAAPLGNLYGRGLRLMCAPLGLIVVDQTSRV